jgi:hypothetical protein
MHNNIQHDRNVNTYLSTDPVVTPENSGPDAVDDADKTPLNTPVSINVLGNDTDPENDTLVVTDFTQGSNGTVSRGANGELVYTPNTDFTGKDSFTYTITDGNGGFDTATVAVMVKGHDGCSICTIAESDEAYTTVGKPVIINVLSNDTGSGISIVDLDNPKHGTAMIVGDSVKYTPEAGFMGTDSFWYGIKDDKGYETSALIVVYID